MSSDRPSSRACGDEMAVALLRVHEEIVRDAASHHDGQVVKSTGDGFLLVFSSCISGVAAALEVRDRLEQYNVTHDDSALHVRIGLNAGPVIEEAGDFYGMTVNAAARVAAKARSGQVLVSEAVRAEASRSAGWTFVDRGLFWLKGLREQWRLHEATSGEAARERRRSTGERRSSTGTNRERPFGGASTARMTARARWSSSPEAPASERHDSSRRSARRHRREASSSSSGDATKPAEVSRTPRSSRFSKRSNDA